MTWPRNTVLCNDRCLSFRWVPTINCCLKLQSLVLSPIILWYSDRKNALTKVSHAAYFNQWKAIGDTRIGSNSVPLFLPPPRLEVIQKICIKYQRLLDVYPAYFVNKYTFYSRVLSRIMLTTKQNFKWISKIPQEIINIFINTDYIFNNLWMRQWLCTLKGIA